MSIDTRHVLIQALMPELPDELFGAAPQSAQKPFQLRIEQADDLLERLAQMADELDPTGDFAARIGAVIGDANLFVIGPWPPIRTKPRPKPKPLGSARAIGPWPPIGATPPRTVVVSPENEADPTRDGTDGVCPHCGMPLP
jgi:hypothetical protein